MDTENRRGKRKTLKGVVISDKMQKTRIVFVERKFPHPLYRKVVRIKKKYKIDDPENASKTGDIVEIMETRPVSKEKCWRLVKIIGKAKRVVVKEKTEKKQDSAEAVTVTKGQ